MKTCEELAAGAIRRGRELKRRRARRRRIWGSTCAALCVAAAIWTAAGGRSAEPADKEPVDGVVDEGSVYWENNRAPGSTDERTAGDPPAPDEGQPSTAPAPEEPPTGDASGSVAADPNTGEGFGTAVYALPADGRIESSGESFTDDEALPLLRQLVSSPTGIGLPADASLTLIEAGHAHIRLPETAGEPAVLTAAFRDYYVLDGETVAAILTVAKENGRFYVTPSFGAPWMKDLTGFLTGHAGTPVLFLYVGNAEVLVAADGDLFCAADPGLISGLPDGERLFGALYCEEAAYVPAA